jgi:UrcA family protein
MKTSFPIASLLLVGLAGAGMARADANVRWIPGPVPQMRVSYADLDMTRSAGRATFDRRVRLAARNVCPPGGISKAQQEQRARCIESAIDGVRMQLAIKPALAS